MFVVYSPEGQSFIGSVQQLPMLRVDPAKRINRVDQDDLPALNVDQDTPQQPNSKKALIAYKDNQKTKRRVVVKAAEIMSSPVIVISALATLEEAWQLMKDERIKYLPVINESELVGICSQTNLLARVIVDKDGNLEGVKPELIEDIMNPMVVTTTGDIDVRHLAEALTEFDIGALVVTDAYQKILGIVTEKDLIKRLAKEPPIEIYT